MLRNTASKAVLLIEGELLEQQHRVIVESPFNPCPGPVSTPPVVFLVGER